MTRIYRYGHDGNCWLPREFAEMAAVQRRCQDA